MSAVSLYVVLYQPDLPAGNRAFLPGISAEGKDREELSIAGRE